jgi:CRISPR type IV-associated protein Csf3
MRPLRIECRLATPWIPSAYGLHLDGLLAWAAVQRELPHRLEEMEHGAPQAAVRDICQEVGALLPLSRRPVGGLDAREVWCASEFFPIGQSVSRQVYFTTKTPVHDMLELIDEGVLPRKGGSTIDTVRGWSKAGQFFQEARHVSGLQAWCIGDPDEIADLLQEVRGVGAKTRLGFGRLHTRVASTGGEDVPDWRIVEDPRAESYWMLRNLPALPDQDVPGAVRVRVLGAVESPYWRPREPVWVARMPELERQRPDGVMPADRGEPAKEAA